MPPPSDWELPEGRGVSEASLSLCVPSTAPQLQPEDTLPVASLTLAASCTGLTLSPSRSCQQAAKAAVHPRH